MITGPDEQWYREQMCQLMIVFKGGVQYHQMVDMPLCEINELIKYANNYLREMERQTEKARVRG